MTEIDLRVVTVEGRSARSGELILTALGDDLPSARFLDLQRIRTEPLADDEIRFEIGSAWHARDAVHRTLIEAIVLDVIPVGRDLPFLG
ncbi:hypothetical protein [Amycolatopsis thermophila]|uniref:Uncharacterized protein n=1 Tax=Amycolatopsis thermophila TaxID=206084 RepID=A0ABU0F592_9PSEU|nr:hypothetical protein [Amycolatopsis thermophila]MDQ0382757.1 hypothetical protein [Amycolatopsis thermophila]